MKKFLFLLVAIIFSASQTLAYTGTIIDPLDIHANKGEVFGGSFVQPSSSEPVAVTTEEKQETKKVVAPRAPKIIEPVTASSKIIFFSGTFLQGVDGWDYRLEYTKDKFLNFTTKKNFDEFIGREAMVELKGTKENFWLQQVYVKDSSAEQIIKTQKDTSDEEIEELENINTGSDFWFGIFIGVGSTIILGAMILFVLTRRRLNY